MKVFEGKPEFIKLPGIDLELIKTVFEGYEKMYPLTDQKKELDQRLFAFLDAINKSFEAKQIL